MRLPRVIAAAVGLAVTAWALPAPSAASERGRPIDTPHVRPGSGMMPGATFGSPPFASGEDARLQAFFAEVAESLEDLDLDLRVQAQLVALAALPDAERLGNAELEINASMWSFGVAVALGYEHTTSPSVGTLDGGFVRFALQWRFLALVHRTLFRWIDPQLELGVQLGGLGNGDESWFRGASYVGGGIDLRFLPAETHVVLTLRYRYSPDPLQLPHGLPECIYVVGLGVRGAD